MTAEVGRLARLRERWKADDRNSSEQPMVTRSREVKNPPKSRTDPTEWLNEKGQPHRIGGPAITTDSGTRLWFMNGRLHRENGPAVQYADGRNEFWRNGLPRNVLDRNAPNPWEWVGNLFCGFLLGAFEGLLQSL